MKHNDPAREEIDAFERIAELETENAVLRRALTADTRSAAEVEARHGRAMAASRTELAAAEDTNEALRRANSELAASRATLREREMRLRLILASATDYAIFTADRGRNITSWNEGAQRLLGWADEEIVGRSADVIFTPEDREAGVPEQEAEGALQEGRAADERWHQRKDGTRFWANGLMLPLCDPEADPAVPPNGLLKLMRDETERRRAEEQKTLLLHEMSHRVKNTLAAVQAIALQTVRGTEDLPSFAATFQARLIALARAHDLLTQKDWEGAALADVARAALNPAGGGDEGRVDLGACASDVLLPPSQALALAMALHEMATNALKHGALSAPGGRVTIVCETDPDGGAKVIEWVERDGPPIQAPPTRRGFGLRLLERGLAMQAGMASDLRFEPEGLRCTLRLPSTCWAATNAH